jgi:hypothetical protein
VPPLDLPEPVQPIAIHDNVIIATAGAYIAVYQSARLRIQLLFHQRGKTSRRTIGESCADVNASKRAGASNGWSPGAESPDGCLSVKPSVWGYAGSNPTPALPAETARELGIPGLAGSGARGHDHPAAGQHDGQPTRRDGMLR